MKRGRGGHQQRKAASARRTAGRGALPGRPAPGPEMLFVERARLNEPAAVEMDRPQAFRPRLVGFWRGHQFHLITRVVDTRREHDATYYRVLTDRGAFDLRHVRLADPVTLRLRRRWEVCAELDVMVLPRLP